jgi:hypothetical protein
VAGRSLDRVKLARSPDPTDLRAWTMWTVAWSGLKHTDDSWSDLLISPDVNGPDLLDVEGSAVGYRARSRNSSSIFVNPRTRRADRRQLRSAELSIGSGEDSPLMFADDAPEDLPNGALQRRPGDTYP